MAKPPPRRPPNRTAPWFRKAQAIQHPYPNTGAGSRPFRHSNRLLKRAMRPRIAVLRVWWVAVGWVI